MPPKVCKTFGGIRSVRQPFLFFNNVKGKIYSVSEISFLSHLVPLSNKNTVLP